MNSNSALTDHPYPVPLPKLATPVCIGRPSVFNGIFYN